MLWCVPLLAASMLGTWAVNSRPTFGDVFLNYYIISPPFTLPFLEHLLFGICCFSSSYYVSVSFILETSIFQFAQQGLHVC